MEIDTLIAQLDRGQIVALPDVDWRRLAPHFEVLEEHDTGLRGMILIARRPAGLLAIESPAPTERVLRPLADEAAAQAFVAARLESYDRMWDGCGCRIDYFAPLPEP